MSTINPQYHNPQLTVQKEGQTSSKANTKPQTSENVTDSQPIDKYDKSSDPNGGVYEGLIRFGEIWYDPNRTLTRIDRKETVTLEESELNASLKTDGMDAQFNAALKKEAYTFSELEKRIHGLLGFTLEAFKTTLDASGQITANQALENGDFFNSSFSAFAAASSITYKYTFDDNFKSQYNIDPQSAVEFNFSSLKTLMESVVISQSANGKATYAFNA